MSRVSLFVVAALLFQLNAFAQQSPAKFLFPIASAETRFAWRGDSMFARWEPYAAMMIPVRLDGCDRTFYLQFDLGSPYSMLYKHTMAAVAQKYPGVFGGKASADTLDHFSFLFGKTRIEANQLVQQPFGSTPANWNDTTMICIGTFGTDLVDGRSLLIDYPQKTIRIGNHLTLPQTEGIQLFDFVYVYGRILLPAVIGEKKTMLFFDTGCSAFSLLTDKPTAMELATPGGKPVVHKSQSWGRQLTISTLPSAANATVAEQSLPLQQVSYVEQGVNSAQAEQMRRMGIQGVTGNLLFTGSVLLIDTRAKQFGVWKKAG